MIPIGAISAGLAALGVGLGIVKIGGSGIKSISDNPEQAYKIQTNMIIAAALIEGVALFAVVVSMLKH
jgi:F-type H+-transporting ATPase subunit c